MRRHNAIPRTGTIAAIVLLPAGLVTGPLAAQDRIDIRPVERPVRNNPRPEPAQARDAMPPCIRPGARITYGVGAVSLTRVGGIDDAPASGHAYVQTDVVAVEGRHVLVDSRVFAMAGPAGPPILSQWVGEKLDTATGGGLWRDPAWLKRQIEQDEDDIDVTEGQLEIEGKTHDVVRIETDGNAQIYDRETGLRLQQILETGGARINRGHLGMARFKDARQKQLPWSDGRMPAWARNIRRLEYQGQFVNQLGTGGPSPAVPINLTHTVKERGENWLLTRQTVRVGGAPGMPEAPTTVERTSGPASLGGLWIDPDKLARLRANQQLDRDPLAGSVTKVTQIYRGGDGRDYVEIGEMGGNYEVYFTYEKSGGMLHGVRLITRMPTGIITQKVWLSGTK
jgi:hypothetical protein